METAKEWLDRGIPTTANRKIKAHEELIEILNAINHYERKKRDHHEFHDKMPSDLTAVKAKYLNSIDTLTRCINRMWTRYDNGLKKISDEQRGVVEKFSNDKVGVGNGNPQRTDNRVC